MASAKTVTNHISNLLDQNKIVIFTDGGASGNPGPGGWGAVLLYKQNRKELGGGFNLTTNNRMELTGVIEALKALKNNNLQIEIFSDSKYVVDSYSKGWAKSWRKKNWIKSNKKRAENVDLWEVLLDLCEDLDIQFNWVKGHCNIELNERCDQIAKEWMHKKNLPNDNEYLKNS